MCNERYDDGHSEPDSHTNNNDDLYSNSNRWHNKLYINRSGYSNSESHPNS